MKRTFNNQQVADLIMDEGIGYAVRDYLSPDSIEDEELRKLWLDAFNALNAIEIKLDEYLDY